MEGEFFFISDDFYLLHDKEKTLMQNKEKTDRPCYFAFEDKIDPQILWFVPISHDIKKYKGEFDKKINRQIAQGKKNPQCNTIRFGKVLGVEKAFLIQNMFPSIKKYISSVYIDRNTGNNVTIASTVKNDIYKNSLHVLKLQKRGINLLFTDVDRIYKELQGILSIEKEKKNEPATDIKSKLEAATVKAAEKNKEIPANKAGKEIEL